MDRALTEKLSPGMRLTLTLGEMGDLGECFASHGLQHFSVFGGIPGELVDAELVRISRNRMSARVVTVLEPSPHRVEPPCPYFWPCTGCQWQHIAYEHQLQLKYEQVKNCLAQHAGLKDIPVLPTMPSPQLYGYRNHARFTVGPRGLLGFVNRITRRFVNVEACALMDPRINQTLNQLQGHCAETTQLSVRCGINTGDQLIQPTLLDNDVLLETGQTHYEETLGGRRFLIGSPSFFQVNTPQAEAMVAHLLNRLSPNGQEVLVDTYAGVGTLAALMAPHVRQVIAIEESAAAIKDARNNVQGLANVEIRQGRTEELLSSISPPPDIVLLDPPRAGCHPTAIAALEQLAPRKIFYVSCNPTTLARDLALLAKFSFNVEEVLPVDLFPQTHHIECIAILSRIPHPRKPEMQPIVLASASPRRQELLSSFGIPLTINAAGIDESFLEHREVPKEVARRLALDKAKFVADRDTLNLPILGADTIVSLDGRILGKPKTETEALQMLRDLRGRSHRVITGVAVIEPVSGKVLVEHKVTKVTMRKYADSEIEAFVASGQAMDKAGAYAIQDLTFHPVESVSGCYSNVMGLPMCTAIRMLQELGRFVYPSPDWESPGPCPECQALGMGKRAIS